MTTPILDYRHYFEFRVIVVKKFWTSSRSLGSVQKVEVLQLCAPLFTAHFS